MNSMTGFGAATGSFGPTGLRIEISGVNRKQTEIVVSLSQHQGELEQCIRGEVASAVSRGRVNVNITFRPKAGEEGALLSLQEKKLAALKTLLEKVGCVNGAPVQITTDSLIRLGIIDDRAELDATAEEIWEGGLRDLLQEALRQFLAMRATEGAHLREDLLARLSTLRTMREEMKRLAADVPQRYKETLLLRLKEHGLMLGDDDERLIKELALFADKCDVSEEMARLESHFAQFEKLCDSAQPVGRTLDFLCQEIFRELNTTGSKANSAQLAQAVVGAKTELEKIREQVQNIE